MPLFFSKNSGIFLLNPIQIISSSLSYEINVGYLHNEWILKRSRLVFLLACWPSFLLLLLHTIVLGSSCCIWWCTDREQKAPPLLAESLDISIDWINMGHLSFLTRKSYIRATVSWRDKQWILRMERNEAWREARCNGGARVWHSKVLPLFLPLLLFQADTLLSRLWSELPHVCVFLCFPVCDLLCPCDPEVVPQPCSQPLCAGLRPSCLPHLHYPNPAVRNPSGKCLPWILGLIFPCIAQYLHWSLRQFSSYLSFGVCCDFHLN